MKLFIKIHFWGPNNFREFLIWSHCAIKITRRQGKGHLVAGFSSAGRFTSHFALDVTRNNNNNQTREEEGNRRGRSNSFKSMDEKTLTVGSHKATLAFPVWWFFFVPFWHGIHKEFPPFPSFACLYQTKAFCCCCFRESGGRVLCDFPHDSHVFEMEYVNFDDGVYISIIYTADEGWEK